jgi:hypothetical protein
MLAHWETRNKYKIFVEKPEGKKPFGKPRRRWEDNIKSDLTERGLGCELDLGLEHSE